MPVSPEFVAMVSRRLAEARPVTFKKMFGGLGFYCDGVFFALSDDDRTFFKVDAATIDAYEVRGMGPWIFDGNVSPNYRELPQDVFEDVEVLGDWIDAAVESARRLKKK